MRQRLSPTACAELRQSVERAEQLLACLLTVEDHVRVVAEARRCRAAIHLCTHFAEGELARAGDHDDARHDDARHDARDIASRAPRIILMETRAQVAIAKAAGAPIEALHHVDCALRDLLDHYTAHATVREYDRAQEVRTLERLRARLIDEIFPGPRAELRRALSDALREERYEDAARLRDRLRTRRPHAS